MLAFARLVNARRRAERSPRRRDKVNCARFFVPGRIFRSMAKGLLKATVSVGAMTLISRILGFVRDMVIARTFGASTGADAFFVAFKIPNFLRRLFAEGAFSQAFVPVLTEYKTRRTPD